MSFSLYGNLPPAKTEKGADDKKETTSTTSNVSSLYSSLPPPDTSSITPSDATISKEQPTTANTSEQMASSTTTTTPTGWSAVNKFRPVLRRPTIQAKPKLNKPFIPAGATVVYEKTVTKEEKELEQTNKAAAADNNQQQPIGQTSAAGAAKADTIADNIDLGAVPTLITTADDVNGFRALQQQKKKKGKKGKGGQQQQQQQAPVFNMLEDYDPNRPNDYEQYKEERKQAKEMQKRKREWERRQREEEEQQRALDYRTQSRSWSRSRSRSRSTSRSRSGTPPYHRRSHSRSYSRSRSRSRSGSRSPYHHRSPSPPADSNPLVSAPAKINVNETAEEAYMRRLRMSQQQSQPAAPPSQLPSIPTEQSIREPHPAHDIARKLLAKHGFAEEGNNSKATRVILLTNMVGPGEVDDMLQEETADECSKYGKVERCLIFEVPKGQIPDDRAVRIFVQFSDTEAAQRAINDLNGRYFGGRVVTATFFDDERFNSLNLAPTKEELGL